MSSSREPAFARVAAHQQNTRFCNVSRTTGVRIQQGSESLAEFAFRNAFRQQQLKCLAPIRRHGFAMHLGGDRRTCACGYSAGAGRSTCVQTTLPGAYETIRHSRDASCSSTRKPTLVSAAAHQQNMEFCATGAAGRPHRYGNRSRSGAGGGRARVDWLCGR